MVLIPAGSAPVGGWPVIAWAHGTSGMARICAPSLMKDIEYGDEGLMPMVAAVALRQTISSLEKNSTDGTPSSTRAPLPRSGFVQPPVSAFGYLGAGCQSSILVPSGSSIQANLPV